MEPKMATITVLETWEAKFPASPERTYTKDGVKQTIEARPARTATLVLAKTEDGTVNQVEIPEGYALPIAVGDVLQLAIPDWPDAPFRGRSITRHIAAKAGK